MSKNPFSNLFMPEQLVKEKISQLMKEQYDQFLHKLLNHHYLFTIYQREKAGDKRQQIF